MAPITRPILSVIVRRFRKDFADGIEDAIKSIQLAVTEQPGFVGLQNSISLKQNDCELVTVITFDTQENYDKWINSPVRQAFVEELDQLSYDNATNTHFGDLTLLAQPSASVRKGEIVVVLIFWILLLSHFLHYPLDYLFPDSQGKFWRSALQTSVVVTLISYVLLPFSSALLIRLKARFVTKDQGNRE